MTDLTISELATLLDVCKRSLERALDRGWLIPSYRVEKNWRARWTPEDAEVLRCRVQDARSRGYKYVMPHITSTGTTLKVDAPSATAFVRRALWTHRHVSQRSSRPAMKFSKEIEELLA